MDQIVPLTTSPNQTFTVQLTVDGNPLTLQLSVYWSYMSGYWRMDISDAQGNLLLQGLPMITGLYPAANILAQQGYLNIGSCYILNSGNALSDYPGLDDLGSSWALLWGDTNAVVTV